MLEVKNLSFSYDNGHNLFSDLSFNLAAGDVLSIIGLNGAGKTTLLRCIMQTISKYEGEIWYDSIEINKQSFDKRSKIMGLVTTNGLTVCDIAVVDYLCMGIVNRVSLFSAPTNEHYRRAYELCEEYEVVYLADRRLHTLSQGELQLVTMLRVLMQNPRIIIMDEPTAALDIKNQRLLLEMIKQLAKDGKIIIQVTHNLDHIFDLGGKVLVISKGRHLFGEVSEVLTERQLSEIYMTEIHLMKCGDRYKVIY